LVLLDTSNIPEQPFQMAPSALKNGSTDSQGPHSTTSPLIPGIYVPTVAFFDWGDEVEIPTTKRHAIRLAHAGITSIVTHGSNGEVFHLSYQECMVINTATREALGSLY
jgi:4-hydroxy-2-oxoglutarate aldolase